MYEQPKLSKPLPYKKNDKFKSFGMYAETDDVRGGMGLEGVAEFEKFVEEGGVLMTFGVASYFPAEFGLARSRRRAASVRHVVRAGAVRADAKSCSRRIRWCSATRAEDAARCVGRDGPLLQVAGQGAARSRHAAAPRSAPRTPNVLVRFQGATPAC